MADALSLKLFAMARRISATVHIIVIDEKQYILCFTVTYSADTIGISILDSVYMQSQKRTKMNNTGESVRITSYTRNVWCVKLTQSIVTLNIALAFLCSDRHVGETMQMKKIS